ncbi:hypothetical protein [Nocardiopsis sp. LOL_012]|uniref:hypothetical protein n=1 Tax=Nocardiopsis sp. LOL_012 TaxID=3345409 RepID=UPI003A886986
MPDSTYHQIHFAWAEPTLLGRNGPGPAATSLPEDELPALRSWRDRLVPALTADYGAALPGTPPSDYPETLWSRAYPDGQAALVYRWPGEVHRAHACAIVGPAHGLTLPRVLSLHENPRTRPAESRPPGPGWETMEPLAVPEPWEATAAPGAQRNRDRRAAETTICGEPVLAGAVAAALAHPERPVRLALEPEHADLWQGLQLRFLWGLHRILYDVLTPADALPAAGWDWSFSTYEPLLGPDDGPHTAFGPPPADTLSPRPAPPPPDFLRVAEALVSLLREEGGDALADHLHERGVPDAPTFTERRDLLRDWLDPRARPRPAEEAERPEPAPRPPWEGDDALAAQALPDLGPDDGEPQGVGAAEAEEPVVEALPEEDRPLPEPGTVPAPFDDDAPGPEPDDGVPAAEDLPPDDTGAQQPPAPDGPSREYPAPAFESDYASETLPGTEEIRPDLAGEGNWPTQYADLPLARLERWHTRRGPEAARVDIVDARAAVRAERAELQRVRGERDDYHAEVQDLRREVARLDQSWIDADGPLRSRRRRRRRGLAWTLALLLAVLAAAAGLEAGARYGRGALDLLALAWARLPLG